MFWMFQIYFCQILGNNLKNHVASYFKRYLGYGWGKVAPNRGYGKEALGMVKAGDA